MFRPELPALGWIERVWRDGDKLFADFKDLAADAAESIKNKGYRYVSAGLKHGYEFAEKTYDVVLDHVALLGGSRPHLRQLPELPTVNFSDRLVGGYTFANEAATADIAADFLMGEGGAQLAPDTAAALLAAIQETHPGGDVDNHADADVLAIFDQLMAIDTSVLSEVPNDRVLSLIQRVAAVREDIEFQARIKQSEYSDEETDMADEGKNPDEGQQDTTTYSDKAEAFFADLEGKVAEMVNGVTSQVQEAKDELAALKAESVTLAGERKRERINAFCDSEVEAGRIRPGQVEATKRLMYSLSTEATENFTDGDGNETSKSQLDLAMDEVKARPVVQNFGDQAATHTGDSDEEQADRQTKAIEKLKAKLEKYNDEHNGELTDNFADWADEDFVETAKDIPALAEFLAKNKLA